MSISKVIKCATCGDFRGIVHLKQYDTPRRAYCKCEPEGWVPCFIHKGYVRRRFGMPKVLDETGKATNIAYLKSGSSCVDDNCFKQSPEYYQKAGTKYLVNLKEMTGGRHWDELGSEEQHEIAAQIVALVKR